MYYIVDKVYKKLQDNSKQDLLIYLVQNNKVIGEIFIDT